MGVVGRNGAEERRVCFATGVHGGSVAAACAVERRERVVGGIEGAVRR